VVARCRCDVPVNRLVAAAAALVVVVAERNGDADCVVVGHAAAYAERDGVRDAHGGRNAVALVDGERVCD
jgi:hypothetical protein